MTWKLCLEVRQILQTGSCSRIGRVYELHHDGYAEKTAIGSRTSFEATAQTGAAEVLNHERRSRDGLAGVQTP